MSEETQLVRRVGAPMTNVMDRMMTEMGTLRFCEYLAESGLYHRGPSALAKIVATIATGAELGKGPMWSLKNIIFVGDKHGFTSGGAADLIMGSGYMMYHVVDRTSQRCELQWLRDGEVVGANVWDEKRARTAGLWGQNTWKKYPESMLFARALTDGARTYCPEIFGGSPYTAEELRSSVVEVRQDNRPPQRQEPDRDRERNEAKASLIAAVHGATDNGAQRKRIWQAISAKVEKTSADMTTEDFRAMAGTIKAFIDRGTLDEWVDKQLGADAIDGEVVDEIPKNTEIIGDEGEWMKANARLHAAWTTYATNAGLPLKGEEYAIIHDVVRERSGLDASANWQDCYPEPMRKMARELEHDGGKLAAIGIANDWRKQAAERGVLAPF